MILKKQKYHLNELFSLITEEDKNDIISKLVDKFYHMEIDIERGALGGRFVALKIELIPKRKESKNFDPILFYSSYERVGEKLKFYDNNTAYGDNGIFKHLGLNRELARWLQIKSNEFIKKNT